MTDIGPNTEDFGHQRRLVPDVPALFTLMAAIAVQHAQALANAQRQVASLQVAVNDQTTRRAQAVARRDIADDGARAARRRQTSDASSSNNEILCRISHELRTPLNSVLGFAQLLELDVLTEPQRDSVSHILRSGLQLLKMVEDVLDITALDSDGLDLACQPVRFVDVLDDAVVEVLPVATSARVTINHAPAAVESTAQVFADPARVRQVLLNLLSNAIKFNHPGGHVDVSCSESEDAHVAVTITDTGTGISAHDLARLFTPFDRLDQSSAVEGTGIGLALAQRLITLMGGQLTVDSAPGRGTTFTVRFPLSA